MIRKGHSVYSSQVSNFIFIIVEITIEFQAIIFLIKKFKSIVDLKSTILHTTGIGIFG